MNKKLKRHLIKRPVAKRQGGGEGKGVAGGGGRNDPFAVFVRARLRAQKVNGPFCLRKVFILQETLLIISYLSTFQSVFFK